MFRGVNTLSLDSKGRMAIPTRYRDQLARACNGLMVLTINAFDSDHCLLLYPQPEWEEIERKIMKLSSFNKQTRKLQRMLVGHATECEMDGNGRILLVPPLREFSGLNKEVVLIGQGNKFEIWDEAKWNARRSEWLEGEGKEDDKLPPDLESLSL
ncbi:MAG: division/cell wall cluster transcriptional repressor MraZ [Gammaproteobacteria bacterium]|nr:division/cell wall cluster transcriptional repressor MraZ [Gammaproteobacteria bacterium]MDH3406072.1 division/cell wall cluster transcriptional repressor MraZ [Gammaproteobacteria bacterium]MDH5486154.1 division/cell wall cluster transcriptional repressor MraZ [Gammaproteobacteria bacterium]